MALVLEQSELLAGQVGLRHFFTTNEGGCSVGNYATFNLGAYCGDLPENVTRNREILCNELNISTSRLIVPREVHREGISLIDEEFFQKSEEERVSLLSESDALITRMESVCLGVTTADCVPLLLYAPQHRIVAAVHAGWRGIACEIISKTIRQLLQMGAAAEELLVSTGPCISAEAYQVGDELLNMFSHVFSRQEMTSICLQMDDGVHADLRFAVDIQLQNAGVQLQNISIHPGCTYYSHRYFSARRQGVQSGRMLSGIMMEAL